MIVSSQKGRPKRAREGVGEEGRRGLVWQERGGRPGRWDPVVKGAQLLSTAGGQLSPRVWWVQLAL